MEAKAIEDLILFVIEHTVGAIQEFGWRPVLFFLLGLVVFFLFMLWFAGVFKKPEPDNIVLLSNEEYKRLLNERLEREKRQLQEKEAQTSKK